MVIRQFTSCMLCPEDIPPSRDELEVVGVFNPGAARIGDATVLLVRVAECAREHRTGYVVLPRWNPGVGIELDWRSDHELEHLDARVVRFLATGLVRLTFVSHIRLAWSNDSRRVDRISEPIMVPEADYEEFGVEDPRITQIENTFWITYVAVSRHGAATALASTQNFTTFQRHGIIFYPENKDVALFPQKIGDAYAALHRPNAATPFTTPEMWYAQSPDLVHWGNHRAIPVALQNWSSGRIGAGPPPIRVPDGWLELYHGNSRKPGEAGVGSYYAGALLLDERNPDKVMGCSARPVLVPEHDFEQTGFMPDVVFPTGLVERDDLYSVYYGAADQNVGVTELRRKDIMQSIVR